MKERSKVLTIAKAIADLRLNHHLTQEEFARMLFVSRDLVSKWETGVRRPDWQTIERMAGLFHVSTDAIVDRNELAYLELEECLPESAPMSVDELASMLVLFLRGIKKNEADIFIQRYYFFEPVSDISLSFGKSENHIRSILSRTRRKLKKHLDGGKNEYHENV